MTVAELLEILTELDPNTEVILQRDSEGNGYSPLYATGMGYYIPENHSQYEGYVYDVDWSADDCGMDHDEWVSMQEEYPISLILAPTN